MLFAPLLFTAHSGVVCFEGRPLSDFTATRTGVAIRRAAMALPFPSKAFDVFDRAHDQLVAAVGDARAQRERAA